jgi:hypothetical protein
MVVQIWNYHHWAEPLVATPAITALPTCANNDGIITMTGTGGPGAGTYYTISPVAGTITGNSNFWITSRNVYDNDDRYCYANKPVALQLR